LRRAWPYSLRQPAGAFLMIRNGLSQIRRWLSGGLLAFLMLSLPGWASPDARSSFSAMVIATGNVPGGKFQALRDIALPHGVELEVVYLDDIPANAGEELFREHDIVLIDTYQTDAVRARLMNAIERVRVPLVWLYEKQASGVNIPHDVAVRLSSYYWNGGKENFEAFFRSVAAVLGGGSLDTLPEPIRFP